MNKLGFGFLRPPYLGEEIDYDSLDRMVDVFMEGGGVYFDTAYTYLGGKSEEAIRRCVAERKPRSSFRLADKLPGYKCQSHADCRNYVDEQLARCGVEWFDVYMLHWLNAANYAIAEEMDEFAFLRELKAEGLTREIGFSYHDSAELLDTILTRHPEVDYVQLQINYLDWESPSIQARLCYETAARHGKKIVIMEPVKGGTLAKAPENVRALLQKAEPSLSPAAQALCFAQSLPQVEVVLSGMNTMEQVTENLSVPASITEAHKTALLQAAELLRASITVSCTGCGYCVSHCPKHIAIPKYFALYNDLMRTLDKSWKIQPVYDSIARKNGKASDCIACHSCERNCPQKLSISEYLKAVAAALED